MRAESTRKRALSLVEIKKVFDFSLIEGSREEFWKDIFQLSFHLIGMNFTDMAYLTVHNIEDGRLLYRRSKTKRLYSIKLTDEAKEILSKYSSLTSRYLLPILNEDQLSNVELRVTLESMGRVFFLHKT